MKRYLYLQLKRNLKIFPQVFMVAVALLLCISILLAGVANTNKNDEKNTRLVVALSGDTDNEFTQMGLTALQTFDDTRFAMELVEMPEEEARAQLQAGKVSAVVIFPEDFVSRAFYGDVEPITFVTTPGGQNTVTLFKDEFTKVIAEIVVASEKGTYAIDALMGQNNLPGSPWDHMNEISMEYVDLILSRAELYEVEELGASQGLNLGQYYLCSMLVFLLMLFGVCFVTVYVKGDRSLSCLLLSKGFGNAKQLLCEYIAHLATFIALVLALILVGGAVLLIAGSEMAAIFPTAAAAVSLCARVLLVLWMLTAFNIMIFEISSDLISGVLLHFFCCIGLCYVSGCFFPVYSLPRPLQKISHFLPTGMAREFLEGAYSGAAGILQMLGVLAFGGAFLGAAILARRIKTQNKRG